MSTVTSYLAATQRIRADGHLFDVGQIDNRTLSQLHDAERRGLVRSSFDSWPLRGYGPKSGEWRRVFTFPLSQSL